MPRLRSPRHPTKGTSKLGVIIYLHVVIVFYALQELLGDRLVTAPVMEGEMSLPSPNQLKYRIILKNKKLLSGSLYKPSRPNPLDEQDEDDDSDYGEEDYEDDIQGVKD